MSKIFWRSVLKGLLKGITIVAIALVTVGFVEVNRVLHPPRVIPPGNTLRKFNIPYQSLTLTTEDGVHLAAWYTPPRNGAVILLAHGYGDNRPEWIHELLAKKGYGIIAWDARAHGESGGSITTIGYLEVLDVKAALQFVRSQSDVKHIGAWGGSMGAATLIRAAAIFPAIEALWIDSSFTSLNDEFNHLVPYPLINPLTKSFAEIETGINMNAIDPLDDIAKISPRAVYIVYGTGDNVVPPNTGQRLYDAARDPRFLWEADDVGHLRIYQDNPRRYKRRLLDFFNQWLLGKQ